MISTREGSTAQSRITLLQTIGRNVAREIENDPANITGIMVIIVRRSRLGMGKPRAMTAAAIWGKNPWTWICMKTGEMLKSVGQQLATKGEDVEHGH